MHWPDSFQANRRIRGANLILQAILFTTLFGGLNYLAQLHSWRFDLTRNRIFSLSAETVSYVENLGQPVHAVVAFDTSADDPEVEQARRDVLALLREYTHVLRRGEPVVSVEEIDIVQSLKRAEQLGITERNVVVFTSGDRSRTVRLGELYRVEQLAKVAFQGEAEFTAAILDVTTTDKQKVYFLTGHGELDPTSTDRARGLSEFRAALRSRNFAIEALDLRQARKVPDDAALVVAIAPLQPFLPTEQELLRSYLNQQTGRVLLAIDPARDRGATTGVEALLADWGLELPDALVVDNDPNSTLPNGDLLLWRYTRHPITDLLYGAASQVAVGPCRPVARHPAGPRNAALRIDLPLLTTNTGFGERTFRGRTEYLFNPETDLKGPVSVLAVAEGESTAGALPFSVRSGRLLVFGSSSFFTNERFNTLGNSMLAVSTVNWSLNRLSQVNVPPRKMEKFQLTLSEPQLARLRLALLLAVPGAVALLGLVVYWSRRS